MNFPKMQLKKKESRILITNSKEIFQQLKERSGIKTPVLIGNNLNIEMFLFTVDFLENAYIQDCDNAHGWEVLNGFRDFYNNHVVRIIKEQL